MIPLAHFQQRRSEFLDSIQGPVLLFSGGLKSRNYPQNSFPFRADSSFLFFFSDPEPDSAALFDPRDRSVSLFLGERTPEDALWHGAVPSFAEMRESQGVDRVHAYGDLEADVARIAEGRPVACVAVADPRTTALATRISGSELDQDCPDSQGPEGVIRALAALRLCHAEPELAQMRLTAEVTREAHLAAMNHTRPGVSEEFLAGQVEGCFCRHGCVPAYGTILSVRGEVLHNVHHRNLLQDGDLLLLDAGAENSSGYCSDVTRTWPVSGRFTSQQRDVYDVVLAAQEEAIALIGPGRRYRDVHLKACEVIAGGLADMGVLRGTPEALVESGAHALFFPHGVGHLIGLDVHDMESFGDRVHYQEGRSRSDEFGLAYLRLDLDLQPGICVTVEPGIYFVPAILRDPARREQFASQVDFERAESFLGSNGGRGFGGIRIEDDVLTTESGWEILTPGIPKQADEVMAAVGTA